MLSPIGATVQKQCFILGKAVDREAKFAGLDDLDVGSKFKMFENGGDDEGPRGPSSDRYGIMEKLKRLQEGEDLDELLAEMSDEFPTVSEPEEDDDISSNIHVAINSTLQQCWIIL